MIARIFARAGAAHLHRDARRLRTAILFAAFAIAVPTRLMATEFRGVRLNVSDPDSAAEWYAKHLGATLVRGDARLVRHVQFGKIVLEFVPVYVSPPIWPVLGSVGSGVDHLGFAYADLDKAMQQFARSGVEIVSGIEREGPIRYAFIKDHWGTLIELVEDREIHGFHHVHLATTDPIATLKWYSDLFGGQVARYAGVLPGIRYGDMWVLVKKVKTAPAPTEGRAIGRLDWSVAGFRELQPRLSATHLPFSVKGVTRDLTEITIDGPDRVQLSILATLH